MCIRSPKVVEENELNALGKKTYFISTNLDIMHRDETLVGVSIVAWIQVTLTYLHDIR
jgi:hypothetical protein